MAKSIMQTKRECYICAKLGFFFPYAGWLPLELHHTLHGTANRKLADQDGLTVYLCPLHHRLLHDKGEHDLELQQDAQKRYMEYYGKTIDEFRSRYGKSYI